MAHRKANGIQHVKTGFSGDHPAGTINIWFKARFNPNKTPLKMRKKYGRWCYSFFFQFES